MSKHRKRNFIKKALSILLAALLCFGAMPVTYVLAAAYNVHTSADLIMTANEMESDNAALIVNTNNFSMTLDNNDFIMTSAPPSSDTEYTRGKMIGLEKSKVPAGEDESRTWTDVCTIKYQEAGYLPNGKLFDLEYHLDSITLTGTVHEKYNDAASLLEIASATDGGAISCSHWCDAENKMIEARTPYGSDYQWSVRVKASDGSSIPEIKMPLLFKDIDIVDATYSGINNSEGITLVSGFESDTWTQNSTNLRVTNGGATYDGTGGSTTDDPRNMVLTVVKDPSFKLSWHGQSCRTLIMPVSATGSYTTIDKTVDKAEAKLGDAITYEIPVTFGPTNEVNAKKSVKVYDDLNEILDISTAVMSVEKGGTDVSSEWESGTEGQRVNFVSKDPANAQGDYIFKITVNITNDAKLVDRLLKEEKVTLQADKINFTNVAYLTFDDASDHSVEVETKVPVKVGIEKPESKISLEKTTSVTEIKNAAVGDVIPYTFKITNIGKMTLYNVNIQDALAVSDFTYDWSACESGKDEMLPGEVAYATANYALTQEDINAGEVLNTATVYGTDINGNTVTDDDDAKTVISGDPDIHLTKTVDKAILKNAAAGDKLNYGFEITNTGNVTLINLVFDDSRAIENLTWDASLASLIPGGVIKGSAEYTLTQEDIDAGEIPNAAVVTGTAPDGSTVTDDDEVKTVVESDPSIHLEKTTDPVILTAEDSVAGHVVPYNFIVKNDGNNTLENIYIVDDLTGISDVIFDWSTASMGSNESLLPGETVSASAFYALTQEDVEKESVLNTATVYGTDPNGTEVNYKDDIEIKLAGADNAKIQLDKEIEYSKIKGTRTAGQDSGIPSDESVADEASEGRKVTFGSEMVIENAKAGMEVPFRFRIENTGHKTLYGVTITDMMEGISAISYDWTSVASKTDTMLPGESAYAYATYKLTQEDIDAGRIDNYAFVTGTPEKGSPVTDDGEAGTPLAQNPEIKIVKETTEKVIENAVAGETVIPYTFVITNTGNNTLNEVEFADDHDVSGLTWERALDVLAPGESVKGYASYTVTQDDIANGSVLNAAFVTAKDPDGTPVDDDDETVTEIKQNASLTLEKTVDRTKIANAKVGDLITYEITSTNDGNITINKIAFADSLTGKGLSELTYEWPGTEGTLLPGQTVTVRATYAVQQADIDAGSVENSVTVTGIPDIPDPDPITPPPSEVVTELDQEPAISVIKTADITEVRDAKAGDEIHYTITGENIGNMTLENVTLEDKLAGIKDMKLSWEGTKGTLLPGEKVTATATYAITADDIAKGSVLNAVIITGEDKTHKTVTDDDEEKSLIPSITTTACDAADGDRSVIAATASAIKDKISFKDFETKSLTIVSTVYDRNAKAVLKVNGKEVTATKNVALKESTGSAEVEISFNSTGLSGKTLSIVTQVYEAGTDKLICQHNTDLSDDAESVIMTGDSTTTITGEKKITATPRPTTVTTRTSNSSNPSSSSTTSPSKTTAESVKTGDDNVARNALIVVVAGIVVAAGCVLYFRKRKLMK